MKIEEIMVGDYLKITEPDKFAGFIGSVQNIGGPSKYLTMYLEPYHDVDVFIEDVEGIPLTSEILEKNFEKKIFYGIYDDYFDLDIREYSDSIYVVTFHNYEAGFPSCSTLYSPLSICGLYFTSNCIFAITIKLFLFQCHKAEGHAGVDGHNLNVNQRYHARAL